MTLTEKDIRTIKYEKRIGFVFSGFVLAFGALFNLFYVSTNQNIDWTMLIPVNSGFLGLGIIIIFLMNRKYNLDLKSGIKIVRIAEIQQIESETSYEAGSGSMYIPILGRLFPWIIRTKLTPYIGPQILTFLACVLSVKSDNTADVDPLNTLCESHFFGAY